MKKMTSDVNAWIFMNRITSVPDGEPEPEPKEYPDPHRDAAIWLLLKNSPVGKIQIFTVIYPTSAE
jgi:hypothetical protein